MILFTREARTNSLMFLLGWLLGLIAIAAVVLTLVNVGDSTAGEEVIDTGIGWGALLLGLGLWFLAYRYWQKRPKEGEIAETPQWMDTLDSVKPGGALGLGVLLSAVNPKTLLLAIAALLTIASAELETVETIIVTLVFILLSSALMIGLIIFFYIAGEGAEKTLNQARSWLIQNNATILMVVFLLLGAKLVGKGLSVF